MRGFADLSYVAASRGNPAWSLADITGSSGYDWIAVPLYPYLYAVEKPQDIPLFTDGKLEAALRDHYRRENYEQLIPGWT